jgi:hypothetical protein
MELCGDFCDFININEALKISRQQGIDSQVKGQIVLESLKHILVLYLQINCVLCLTSINYFSNIFLALRMN